MVIKIVKFACSFFSYLRYLFIYFLFCPRDPDRYIYGIAAVGTSAGLKSIISEMQVCYYELLASSTRTL